MKSALAAIGALLMGVAPLAAAEPEVDIPPVEVLPLSFAQSGLSGAGGERIKADLADAQFVALGEDHGFADAPKLAQALSAEMERRGGPVYHAAEIGPFSAKWLHRHFASGTTSDGLKRVAAGLKGKGLAMPFTSNVEDATLAAGFFDADGTSRLWGIDQEFMGAPMILLEALATRTQDKAARSAAQKIAEADRAALAKLDFDNAWLAKAKKDDFEELARAFATDPDAPGLMEAFATSAEIYQLNNSGSYAASNEFRSALMQGYFLENYRKAGRAPKVLLKMGAYHLGRGTTPVGIYDLGSLLPGLAAANGKKSLHIVFIPLAGSVRSIALSDTGVTAVKPYQDEGVGALLTAAGLSLDSLPATGHVVIPTTAIRLRLSGKQKRELPEMARFILNGFDYLVTTRDAKAATHFEDCRP
jgi:hypothetical protein